MGGYRLLAKNIGLLTLANFGTKILTFLMVPLYTSVLTTQEYGIYDVVFNTICVLVPLFTQNIIDAVLRFSMGEGRNKKDVFSIGIKHFLISLMPVSFALIMNYVFQCSAALSQLSPFVMLMFVSHALSGIVVYYARGLNKFSDVAIASVINCILIIVCNVLFLLVFQWGLSGYFLANIIGPLFQSVYLLIRVNPKEIQPFRVDKELEQEMLAYSRPMIANSLAWWVNSVSDRYIVTIFCGVGINGIYSVASKIPAILNTIQNIFGQAWVVSAVEEFDPEDSNGFFAKMYAGYNCTVVIACSAIIACNIPLASLLYANEFFEAWQFVPYLTIAIVFGSLVGYAGGILASVKDAKEFARSSVVGALTNLILNLITVPLIGALGAAISTLVSYWLVWVLRMKTLKNYIKLKVRIVRDVVSYCLLIIQGTLYLLPIDFCIVYAMQGVIFICLLIMYRKELKGAIRKMHGLIRKGR